MALLLLLPLILVPGASVLLAFGSPLPRAGFFWRAALAGFPLLAAAALLLAQLSRFSPAALCGVLAALSAALLVARRAAVVRRLRALAAPQGARATVSPWAALALAGVVLAAGALGAHLGEHYAGGWDPGVYLAAGSSIARRGGLIVRDSLLVSLGAAERDALFPSIGAQHLKYPGFYVRDAAGGTLVPQFQPLYPALLALLVALAGERAALFLNPALGLAAILLLYRIVSVARGRALGLGAAALFAFNVVQVWNARFPTSEMTAQALLLTGFVLLADFLVDGDPALGALAGLAFGLAPAATVTAVLVVPFALAAVLRPGGARAALPFVGALALALAQGALWSAWIAPEYLASVTIFFPGLRRDLLVALPAFAFFAWFVWSERRRFAAIAATGTARWALAAGFLCALLWFAVARPLLDPSDPARAFEKISRYLTPGVLLLFGAGGAAHLARGGRRVETALLLGGAAMLFFFLHDPRMYPTYPFTLRRFTPLAIPAIASAAALLPATLLEARRGALRAAGAALLAAAILVPLYKNRELVRLREYEGFGSFLAGLAAELPAKGLLLSEGRLPASYLEHAAGREVLTLYKDSPERAAAVESFAERRLAAGEAVTLITPAELPWTERLRFEPLFTRRLRTQRLSQELTRYPSPVRQVDQEYRAFRVTLAGAGPAADRFPAQVDLGENALGLGPGFALAVPIDSGGRGAWARWTGATAELTIPWPETAGAAVVLRAASGAGRPALARVRILLDGEPLGVLDAVPPQMTEVILTAATSPPPRQRRRLRIESSTWNPREQGLSGYPDGLGLLVDWVEIRVLPPAAGHGRP